MSHRFTLQLLRMKCIHEAIGEWGKDEMNLFGFAISRRGHLFATGYRGLGSYSDGDEKSTGIFPMMLFDAELEDDGLEVILYLWLVEEDSGGVKGSAASLEAEMREAYRGQATRLLEIRFPRDCIPFTAFYKAVLPFKGSIAEAATDGANNDELYEPWDILLDYQATGPSSLSSSREFSLQASKNAGHYVLTFRLVYQKIPELFA